MSKEQTQKNLIVDGSELNRAVLADMPDDEAENASGALVILLNCIPIPCKRQPAGMAATQTRENGPRGSAQDKE